jgi:F0F1-type ATP synthase membrane subunit b/b'
LEKEVVSIASLMAEKVIGKKIDEREFQDVTIKNIESSEEL